MTLDQQSDRGSPCLSVVVTSRNDGHGGNPLGRLQAFINTFDAQCRRCGLDAELIIVEWNPPPDRPRLRQVVQRPAGCAFRLRFIEVPPPLHERLPRASVLPLFQMIGKNAGIRRARGRFVLATNIDIIFSNELVEFFAAGRLETGVIYRVDRHDIESNYPIETALDDQMAYCRTHHLRVHRSSGTYPVDSQGDLLPLSPDVFDAPRVTIGDGWHMREGDASLGYYRWATELASLIVSGADRPSDGEPALDLEIEPNPYDPDSWVDVEVADRDRVLGRARISDRRLWRVPLGPASGKRRILLRTVAASPERSLPPFERRAGLRYRLLSARLHQSGALLAPMTSFPLNQWRAAHRDATTSRSADGLTVRSAAAHGTYALRYGPLFAPRAGTYRFALDCSCLEGHLSWHVADELTDRWIPADQYETVEGDRRRLVLTLDLARGQAFSLYVANRHRRGDAASTFVVHATAGSVAPDECRFRAQPDFLFQGGRLAAAKVLRRIAPVSRFAASGTQPPSAPAAPTSALGSSASLSIAALANVAPTARIETYLTQHRPAAVHRNAAGDFQLMAREHWFEVRGYPEFTMYSMNVDGLLGDIVHHVGVREIILATPIYHLEHLEGSGWTPEGEGLLRKRLADSGADWLDATTVDLWSAWMDWLKRPMIFNGSDWGVGDAVLPETIL
ncbi:MAG: hypothetical protein ACRD2I_23510 [Vicinamibacterales bacterium]